jgi:hypothetical protein
MGMTRDVVSFAFLFDESPLLHVGDYSWILCFLKHYSIHFIRFALSVAATDDYYFTHSVAAHFIRFALSVAATDDYYFTHSVAATDCIASLFQWLPAISI